MNMELAYRCQMLPASVRKSYNLTQEKLLLSGWRQSTLDEDLTSALNWANSHCVVAAQEKARANRLKKKMKIKGDDALDAMFVAVGADPTSIPRRAG
jgi:hypothetical protein